MLYILGACAQAERDHLAHPLSCGDTRFEQQAHTHNSGFVTTTVSSKTQIQIPVSTSHSLFAIELIPLDYEPFGGKHNNYTYLYA